MFSAPILIMSAEGWEARCHAVVKEATWKAVHHLSQVTLGPPVRRGWLDGSTCVTLVLDTGIATS